MKISQQDLNELKKAKLRLENPGLVAKITDLIGTPIEKGFEMLPDSWSEKVGTITKSSLLKAVDVAMMTIGDLPGEESSNWWHKLAVATTGGISGLFGLPALAVELPVTTTIMLRSIADIARSEGESVEDFETKLNCIAVFALGGPSDMDDASESGYFAARVTLAKAVAAAAEHVAKKGLAKEGAPALVKFISQVAERLTIQVTEKGAAQAIPLIGAAGGVAINTLFLDHFQDMAHGHFTVRRLERKYCSDVVRKAYDELPE